jgi:HEAT repeat protein
LQWWRSVASVSFAASPTEALRDADGKVRGRAVTALGEIGPAALGRSLTEALRDADGDVRVRLAGALGNIGQPLPRPFASRGPTPAPAPGG